MKSKNVILPLMIGIMFILLIGSVSAAASVVTLTKPANSALVSGTYAFNVSVANPANNFSCTLYGKSASTANSTWTALTTYANQSGTIMNTTFNSLALEDSNDYIFNASCGNNTGKWALAALVTDVRIDNTVPQAATSLSPADNDLMTSAATKTFSGTVVDKNTTGCTLYVGINGGDWKTYAMTYATTTCSYDYTGFTDSNVNANYFWYIQSSDGTNTTNSATRTEQVQITPPAGGVANQAQIDALKKQQGLSSGSGLSNIIGGDNEKTIFVIVAILIIIAIIYFARK